MTSFLQYGRSSPGPMFRPVVVGALTCGALMFSAGVAQAAHMPNGMCPHGAGTDPATAGSAPAERAASSAPLGTTRSAAPAPAARPAAKPAAKAPVQRPAAQAQVQRPATQAQAQQPATSQAQGQRPAATSQRATSKAQVAVPAQRQAPVAKPSVRQQPRADANAGQRSGAERQVARPAVAPVVAPEITTDQRSVPVERPTAVAASPVASGDSVPVAIVAALLALCGIIVAVVAAVRRRVVPVTSASTEPTLVASKDAAIEAELQEIIVETRARALRAPAGIEDEGEDRELSQTH